MTHIDVTPTWAALLPALLAVLKDGTPEGQAMAREELFRLAVAVDAANARARSEAERPAIPGELAALQDAARDAAALLSVAIGGRETLDRGQARATIRDLRAALASFNAPPVQISGAATNQPKGI